MDNISSKNLKLIENYSEDMRSIFIDNLISLRKRFDQKESHQDPTKMVRGVIEDYLKSEDRSLDFKKKADPMIISGDMEEFMLRGRINHIGININLFTIYLDNSHWGVRTDKKEPEFISQKYFDSVPAKDLVCDSNIECRSFVSPFFSGGFSFDSKVDFSSEFKDNMLKFILGYEVSEISLGDELCDIVKNKTLKDFRLVLAEIEKGFSLSELLDKAKKFDEKLSVIQKYTEYEQHSKFSGRTSKFKNPNEINEIFSTLTFFIKKYKDDIENSKFSIKSLYPNLNRFSFSKEVDFEKVIELFNYYFNLVEENGCYYIGMLDISRFCTIIIRNCFDEDKTLKLAGEFLSQMNNETVKRDSFSHLKINKKLSKELFGIERESLVFFETLFPALQSNSIGDNSLFYLFLNKINENDNKLFVIDRTKNENIFLPNNYSCYDYDFEKIKSHLQLYKDNCLQKIYTTKSGRSKLVKSLNQLQKVGFMDLKKEDFKKIKKNIISYDIFL